jgi:hypothetical protein
LKARETFGARDALLSKVVDRLKHNRRLTQFDGFPDPTVLFVPTPMDHHVVVNLRSQKFGEGLHDLQIALGQRRVRQETETTKRTVHAAVAQTDGHAHMRSDRNLGSFWQDGSGWQCTCVVDQFRQSTIDDALTIAGRERRDVANVNRRAIFRIDVGENAIAGTKFGNECHVHTQMRPYRMEHTIDIDHRS